MYGQINGISEHLNREYSPSSWSKRFSNGSEVMDHHLYHITIESCNSIREVKSQLNVRYGPRGRELMDIFGVDLPDDAPIVVFIHGGFWHDLSRQQSHYFAKSLFDIGIKTIILGYDLCPVLTLKEITEQIPIGIQHVFKYAGTKNSRAVYLVGHSAGAHLVAKFMANKAALDSIPNLNILRGAFMLSGIYDLTELIQTDENQYLNLTLKEAKELSPQTDNYSHMRNLNVRLYILAAENDSYTFKKQSSNFYDMLMECCPVQNLYFEIKNNFDHFDIVEVLSQPDNYFNIFLQEDLSKM